MSRGASSTSEATTATAPGHPAGQAQPASISAEALAALIRSGAPHQLVDVREPFETDIAAIAGAELIPLGSVPGSLGRFRRDAPVVLFCHHDTRSRRAAGILQQDGGRQILWLEGGIDAWARLVDPTLERY